MPLIKMNKVHFAFISSAQISNWSSLFDFFSGNVKAKPHKISLHLTFVMELYLGIPYGLMRICINQLMTQCILNTLWYWDAMLTNTNFLH